MSGLALIISITLHIHSRNLKIRDQAAIVAELFAAWTAKPINVEKMNKLLWEANLWLPDKLAKKINDRIMNTPQAPDVRKLLLEIKKILQNKASTLEWEEIPYFDERHKSTFKN